jgi:hypothetical protein
MTEKNNKQVQPGQQEQLSPDELQEQQAQYLPDRENMSLVNANLAAPINAAVAANVLSDNSVAYADATQTAPIDQTTAPTAPLA